mmetsp:Transcript_22608/g.89462  ORF Transcript_22608/g.89462 Transcript_22608/m.89462 type:complete len:544 (+) Transcript_22608:547-2178(+)
MNRPREGLARPGDGAADEEMDGWEEQLVDRANLDKLLSKALPDVNKHVTLELAADGSNFGAWLTAVKKLTRGQYTLVLWDDENGDPWREDVRVSRVLEDWRNGREGLDVSDGTLRYLDALMMRTCSVELQEWLERIGDVRLAWVSLGQRFEGSRQQQLARAIIAADSCSRKQYGSDLEYVQARSLLWAKAAHLGHAVPEEVKVAKLMTTVSAPTRQMLAASLAGQDDLTVARILEFVGRQRLWADVSKAEGHAPPEASRPAIMAAARPMFRCYHCKQKGHLRRNCPKRGPGTGQQRRSRQPHAPPAREGSASAPRHYFGACAVGTFFPEEPQEHEQAGHFVALVDSGQTYDCHLTGDKSLLSNAEPVEEEVHYADGSAARLTLRGTVRGSMVDSAGVEHFFNFEMGYVPGMRGTLLSTNRLARCGIGYNTLHRQLYFDDVEFQAAHDNTLRCRLVSAAEWSRETADMADASAVASDMQEEDDDDEQSSTPGVGAVTGVTTCHDLFENPSTVEDLPCSGPSPETDERNDKWWWAREHREGELGF